MARLDPTSSIRKLGFRRWYERELIKSHGALVTCFLCGILVAALIEQVNVLAFGWRWAMTMGIVFGSGILGWVSYRAYITLLERAERYGQCSTCPQCGAYGRFKVIATGMDDIPGPVATAVAPLNAAWLRVECRMCGMTWRMPE